MENPTITQVLEFVLSKCFNGSGYIKNSIPTHVEQFIIESTPNCNTENIVERIYWLKHDITSYPTCKQCGKEMTMKFVGMKFGYHQKEFCNQKCSTKHPDTQQKLIKALTENLGEDYKKVRHDKAIATNLIKYGCISPLSLESTKTKSRQTKLERHGNEKYTNTVGITESKMRNFNKTQELKLQDALESGIELAVTVRQLGIGKFEVTQVCSVCNNIFTFYADDGVTRRKTCSKECLAKTIIQRNSENGTEISQLNQKKYGCNAIQVPEIKEKMIKTRHTNKEEKDVIMIEKYKITSNKNHGVDFPALIPEIYQKTKDTKFAKYGNEYFVNPEQTKITLFERYGDENYNNREQAKLTCLERYGVEHQSQNPEILERQQKNAYRLKEFTFPSGNIIKIQGYESIILKELLRIYVEGEILVSKKDVPVIKYTTNDNINRRYFSDFYIPKDKLIIEVKSTYTAQCEIDNTKLKFKQQACIDAGYNYKIFILTQNKTDTLESIRKYLLIDSSDASIEGYFVVQRNYKAVKLI